MIIVISIQYTFTSFSRDPNGIYAAIGPMQQNLRCERCHGQWKWLMRDHTCCAR
jgi:hypothetical protein